MHLIAPLVSGINGAANGSVSIYKRGTQTFASVYASFEAAGQSTPSAALTLDTNGGRVVYVNEEVECVVRDASGNIVRDFVAGDNISAIEAITQSFTGVDYTTGQSGASKPVTLQTVFDLWKTSSGTTDFSVLISGVKTTLQTGFANAVTSLFFNVKASTYGAVGDGAADDTSAIQAAMNAASAAGGGTVFFPKGTYKTSSSLSLASGCSILGAGSGAASIVASVGMASVLSVGGAAGVWTSIRDVSITQSAGQSTATVADSGAVWLRIDGCKIATTKASGYAISLGNGTSKLVCTGCTLDASLGIADAASRLYTGASGSYGVFFGCTFLFPSGPYSGVAFASGSSSSIVACDFRMETVTSGTSTLCSAGSNDVPSIVAGNVFRALNATVVCTLWEAVSAVNISFLELGNMVAQLGAATYTYPTHARGVALANKEGLPLMSRAARFYTVASNAAAITLPTSEYGNCEVVRTSNAIQTVSLNDPPSPGHFATLAYNNNNAAVTGTITIGGTNVKGLTTFTVNANRVSYYHFRAVNLSAPAFGATYWSLVGSDLNEVP